MEASEGISPKPLALFHWQHCILNNRTKKGKKSYKRGKKNQEGEEELVSSAVESLKKKKKDTVKDFWWLAKTVLSNLVYFSEKTESKRHS